MSVFQEWTCVFPGKLGLSWKQSPPYGVYDTKEEAEAQAAKNCNVVAVPLLLYERMKEHERRMVRAEVEFRSLLVRLYDHVRQLDDCDNDGDTYQSDRYKDLLAEVKAAVTLPRPGSLGGTAQ